MPWLAHHNPEIDQGTGEVKMKRCLEECGKQQRPKQGKSGWQKQKEEEKKEEEKRNERRKTKEKRMKRRRENQRKKKQWK